MGWARFDDAYTDHPKVVSAGPLAELLDMRAILFSARYETDGHIPPAQVARIGVGVPALKKRIAALVEVERWHEPGHQCKDCPQILDGWVVHGYLDYNPASDKKEAEREAARERMRRAREAKREANKGRSSDDVRANDGRSSPEVQECSDNPVPSPTPKAKPSSDAASGADPVEAFGQTAVDLTRHLATRVQTNGHKVPGKGSATAWRWFETIERLLRIDGADPGEVRRVVDWCTDDDFWRANIQSAGKFREKYSSLRLRMLNDSPAAHEPAYGDDPAADGSVRGVM